MSQDDAGPGIVQRLRELARNRHPRVIFADADHPRIDAACQYLRKERIVEPIVIQDPRRDAHFEDIACRYYHQLRDEGVTEEGAVALAEKPAWFAAGMTALGQADAFVCGPTTSGQQLALATLRALAPGRTLDELCSATLLLRAEQALTLADAHVVDRPEPARLAEIAKVAADLHRRLSGDEPRIAFLAGAEVEVAQEAVGQFRDRWPGLDVETAAADALLVDCHVDPNVLIVPNRCAGAAALGLLARFGSFRVLGPIIHGADRVCVGVPGCADSEDLIEAATIAASLCNGLSL